MVKRIFSFRSNVREVLGEIRHLLAQFGNDVAKLVELPEALRTLDARLSDVDHRSAAATRELIDGQRNTHAVLEERVRTLEVAYQELAAAMRRLEPIAEQTLLRAGNIEQRMNGLEHSASDGAGMLASIADSNRMLMAIANLLERGTAYSAIVGEEQRRDLALLLARSGIAAVAVRVETEHPVAVDSTDHLFPRGTMQDNTRHPRFVRKCEAILPSPIRHLDLGCSGGGLVWDFTIRGHFSIGIEGSDYSLKAQRAEWRVIPDRLFTADVRFPFSVRDDKQNTPIAFDMITAWELLEHIEMERVPDVIRNIAGNLRSGGYFVGSIATVPDEDVSRGIAWHKTLQDREWWEREFAAVGFAMVSDLFEIPDFARGSGNQHAFADWDVAGERPEGFHLVAQYGREPSVRRRSRRPSLVKSHPDSS